MGRTAEGWKLVWKNGIAHVRFRLPGKSKREEITTRQRHPVQAAEVAGQIYADFISGRVRRVSSGAIAHPATPVDELCAEWIADIMSEISGDTDGTYEIYARHWSKHFGTAGALNRANIGDYQRRRLESVQRSTVVKERSALLRFLTWLEEKGHINEVPAFPRLPKKATGTRHKQARLPPQIELAPNESEAILAALPELSLRSRKGKRFPVRARFLLAYDTGLRPETIDLLVGGDVTANGLRIRKEVDKNQWGRTLPLTERASVALRGLGARRDDEPLFGSHDYRTVFRKACVAALGAERGKLPTPYDLKHARVTHLLDAGAPVTGVRFLTGTNVALDHYVQSTRRAAELAIGCDSGAETLAASCEGEDLNLHGSYPASTSIESDNRHIRGKLGDSGSGGDSGELPISAPFGVSDSHSGALHPNRLARKEQRFTKPVSNAPGSCVSRETSGLNEVDAAELGQLHPNGVTRTRQPECDGCGGSCGPTSWRAGWKCCPDCTCLPQSILGLGERNRLGDFDGRRRELRPATSEDWARFRDGEIG